MTKKKVLFINFGGLGDEILFLPTVLSVKAQYPDTEITLALEDRSRGITSLTNVIDKTLYANIKSCSNSKFCNFLPKKFGQLFNKYNELLKLLFRIWGGNYDLVVSSGSNKYISVFLAMTLIPKRIGYNTGKLSEKLLTKAVTLNKNQYAVDMYHDLVKPLTDIKVDLPIFCIEKKQVVPNTVLIHPGVSRISVEKGMLKTVPPETWAKVIELLADSGKHVILAGGPDDWECIETIKKLVPCEKYTNMFGKTKNLKELAELISSSEIFLCSDSAPLHIAVGMGTKTYVIFGSTDDKKLIPQNGLVIPVKNDCKCSIRPCLWEHRQTTCQEVSCLNFTPEQIVSYIIK